MRFLQYRKIFEYSTGDGKRHFWRKRGKSHIDLRDSNEQINPASDAGEFVYDPASGVLCCRLPGRITDQRIIEYYALASSYISKINPLAGIVDLSGATALEISTQTMKNLAAAPAAFPDVNLLRIIVAPAPHIFGMTRMFRILGGATRPMPEVVPSMKEACALLDIMFIQPVVID